MSLGNEMFKGMKTVSFFKRDELSGIKIQNSHAEAEIFIQGAQLTHFQASGKQATIWCSRSARFKKHSAVRGGIPLCWPWFGDLNKNPERVKASMLPTAVNAHGFARNLQWELKEISEPSPSETIVKMALSSNEYTQSLFPHAFQLVVEFSISDQLCIHFLVINTGKESFSYTAALHSYFAIGDITQSTVSGFDQGVYIDALDHWQQKIQEGCINVDGEVDRIYLDTPDTCRIQCAQKNRLVQLDTVGSRSTVIWNPWIDKSKRLSDFDKTEYKEMLCIETANALQDYVTLKPGKERNLTLKLTEV